MESYHSILSKCGIKVLNIAQKVAFSISSLKALALATFHIAYASAFVKFKILALSKVSTFQDKR